MNGPDEERRSDVWRPDTSRILRRAARESAGSAARPDHLWWTRAAGWESPRRRVICSRPTGWPPALAWPTHNRIPWRPRTSPRHRARSRRSSLPVRVLHNKRVALLHAQLAWSPSRGSSSVT